MLYHLYDCHKSLMAPLGMYAHVSEQAWRQADGVCPFPQDFTRFMAAGSEMVERATRTFHQPTFGLRFLKPEDLLEPAVAGLVPPQGLPQGGG